jgi:hypothetical protein
MQVPKVYQALASWIEVQRAETPRLSFEEVCRLFPGVPERSLDLGLEFLAEMGICVWHRKMRLLILDPQWLANTFR